MPPDMTAGFPDAAARLMADRDRVGARALEAALDATKGMRERYDERGLQLLLRDTRIYVERIAKAVSSGDAIWTREWADWVSPVYRRRGVPMADLVALSEGLRGAAGALLSAEERVPLDAAIDAAVKVFRYYGRISGDARKRNRIAAALYKGA